MPGLTGLAFVGCQRQDGQVTFDAMVRKLIAARGLLARRLEEPPEPSTGPPDPGRCFHCLALSRPSTAGVARRRGSALVIEGFVLGLEEEGSALAAILLERFFEEGERFVSRLRGSFQIAVHHRGTTYLYADPVASRRLFYAVDRGGLLFSPEIAPLTEALGRSELDAANLVQFLVTGRFFAGETLLTPVRQLRPGEYLVFRDGRPELISYFRYEIAPPQDLLDPEEALPEFEARLERAILESWQKARRPTFLLSGGYDSRFIFYTIARAVPDTTELYTVIWGENPDRPHSDTWISGRIARRFGTRHLVWPWGPESIPENFDEMFRAQSGMTDYVFTHVDELLHCRTLHREHGREALYRGDENFGPQKAEVKSPDDALERMGMYRNARLRDRSAWFTENGDAFLEAHAERLSRLLDGAPHDPRDLRDTLYARERLPAFQQQLNAHRSHDIEMFNPLLDADVLRLYRRVPAPYRWRKRFFKMAFERQHGRHLEEIPIATHGNPIDWPRALERCSSLRSFLRRGLEDLPPPLDRPYFLGQLDAALGKGGDEYQGRDARICLPPERMAMRAFVLSRWLRSWCLV